MNQQCMHHVDLSDHRAAYAEVPGDSSVRPLVLLHGGGVDHRMWAPQFAAFPGRRIVAPDARGHGSTPAATAPFRLADDVIALLDRLEIERAVVIGLSMGGGTAVDLALEYPSRVAGLVVSGTGTSEPAFTDPWVLGIFADWAAAQERGDAEAWLDAFMRFTHGPERGPSEVADAVWRSVEKMARETLAQHVVVDEDGVPQAPIRPTTLTQTWERLPEIRVPVLAICGAQDSVDHRAMGARLARSVPVGRYRELPASAHYPNLERPDEFNAAVSELLTAHGL